MELARYLAVARSGAYANFAPPELKHYYEELDRFLLLNGTSLGPIEQKDLYELLFYLSLLTNNDVKAKLLLSYLQDQFDISSSQRLKLMRSMYLEATEGRKAAMSLMNDNANEIRLARRLTTFSRNYEDPTSYIKNLNFYLSVQPLDLLTWAELADEYFKLGHYHQAIFAYKEVIISQPFAYPFFYRVGLSYYYLYVRDRQTEDRTSAREHFLRSVEICGSFAKGWLGVSLTSEGELKAVAEKEFERVKSEEKSAEKSAEGKI